MKVKTLVWIYCLALVGNRTAKSWLNAMRITESQFANDLELYTSGQDKLENMSAGFVKGTNR